MRFSDLEQPKATPVPGHPGVFVRHGTIPEHDALSSLLLEQEANKDTADPNEQDKELLRFLIKTYIVDPYGSPFECDEELTEVRDTLLAPVIQVVTMRRQGKEYAPTGKN